MAESSKQSRRPKGNYESFRSIVIVFIFDVSRRPFSAAEDENVATYNDPVQGCGGISINWHMLCSCWSFPAQLIECGTNILSNILGLLLLFARYMKHQLFMMEPLLRLHALSLVLIKEKFARLAS